MHSGNQVEATVAEGIAQHIFQVMPLLKKRLINLSAIPEAHGMPLSHVQVLAMLNETGSMSVTEISRRFGIAKPNITPLVDRMLAAGWVDRVRSGADRRVVNVVIQEAGRHKLNEIQSALDAHVLSWADEIHPMDLDELASALDVIVRVLSDS